MGERLARRTLLAFLLLLGVVAFFHSPFFRLAGVDFEGNRILSDAELRAALPLTGRPNLFQIDLDRLEAALLELPPVKAVRITRKFPGELKVVVQEREPVLILESGGGYRAVDGEGFPFLALSRPDELPLPRFRSSPPGRASPDIREAARLASFLPPQLRAAIAQLRYQDEGFVLVARDGSEILWGTLADSEQKARVLLALWEQEEERPARIDVRVPSAPTSRRN